MIYAETAAGRLAEISSVRSAEFLVWTAVPTMPHTAWDWEF